MRFEYKVVPVPTKGKKVKGVKTPEARYALALQEVMGTLGAEGWVYVGREEHDIEARKGLFGKKETRRQAFLMFRRDVPVEDGALAAPVMAPEAGVEAPVLADPAPVETPPAAVAVAPAPAKAEQVAEAAPSSAAQDLAHQIEILSKRLENLNAPAQDRTPVAFPKRGEAQRPMFAEQA